MIEQRPELAGQPAPGAATRGFLRACDERMARPVDWSLAPGRYKRYLGTARLALDDGGWPGVLLRNLLGLTRISWCLPHDEAGRPVPGRGRVVPGRPAPSGGALYPIEAYPATQRALCHYDIAHHCLEVVRDGDHRDHLAGMLARPTAGPGPDIVLALTAVFWRNGFKYDDFAYRLQCQEIGILAAQALALSEPLGLDAAVHIDFDGEAADRLLGLDPAAEGCLATLSFSRSGGRSAGEGSRSSAPSCGEAARPAEPPQAVASRLPCLAALHAATQRPAPATQRLPDLPDQADPPPVPPPPSEGQVIELPTAAPVPAADGVGRRASPLNGYRPEPTAALNLARVLVTSTAGYPGDFPGATREPQATALFVLALNIAGIPAGIFRYLPARHALAQVGDPASLAGITGGPLRANTSAAMRTCAAVLVPAGDPLAGTRRFGDLWYRLQQAETGLVVHRAALAAAALGLASRIHSDGTNPATDAALGLTETPWRSLSFLLVGTPRTSGPARTVPAWPGRASWPPAVHPGKPGNAKEY